jgi:hypothetical protein
MLSCYLRKTNLLAESSPSLQSLCSAGTTREALFPFSAWFTFASHSVFFTHLNFIDSLSAFSGPRLSSFSFGASSPQKCFLFATSPHLASQPNKVMRKANVLMVEVLNAHLPNFIITQKLALTFFLPFFMELVILTLVLLTSSVLFHIYLSYHILRLFLLSSPERLPSILTATVPYYSWIRERGRAREWGPERKRFLTFDC